MKILIFGATGMVGQGVLREALLAGDVTQVLVIGRSSAGVQHPKLHELVHADLFDYRAIEDRLQGFDACFFCLGASSAGLDEAAYTRINHDLPVAAAQALSRLNPEMTFVYVSGAGTGSQSTMWARVKRRTEAALLAMPFKAAYMLRPGIIQPLNGARSKTPIYRALYAALSPVISWARRQFPNHVVSTADIGLAMLNVARHGSGPKVIEASDIRVLSEQ